MPARIGLIDIGHRCEYRAVTAQQLGFEAAFPESAGASVFPIGAASDGLHEASHQPGQAAQACADQDQTILVRKQLPTFEGPRKIRIFAGREQSNPALGDFRIAPRGDPGWIHLQYQMQMIAHDGIRLDGHRETFGDEVDPVFDPRLAVLE